MTGFDCAALVAASALALVAAWTDWRARVVPHWVPVALVATWAVAVAVAPGALGFPPAVAVACAAVTLAAGFALFHAGWLGGGDGKLLAALALWLGPFDVGFVLVCAAALTLAFAVPAWTGRAPDMRRRGLPLACAFAPPVAAVLLSRMAAFTPPPTW